MQDPWTSSFPLYECDGPLRMRQQSTSLIRKSRRLILVSGVIGWLIATTLLAYLVFSYPNRNPKVEAASNYLVPTSFLTLVGLDTRPTRTEWTIVWFVIELTNAILYGLIGALIGRIVWRPRVAVQSRGQWVITPFHEKAGLCQAGFFRSFFSCNFSHRQGSPCAPVASVATLPSAVGNEPLCSLQVGCFSLQPVLPPV